MSFQNLKTRLGLFFAGATSVIALNSCTPGVNKHFETNNGHMYEIEIANGYDNLKFKHADGTTLTLDAEVNSAYIKTVCESFKKQPFIPSLTELGTDINNDIHAIYNSAYGRVELSRPSSIPNNFFTIYNTRNEVVLSIDNASLDFGKTDAAIQNFIKAGNIPDFTTLIEPGGNKDPFFKIVQNNDTFNLNVIFAKNQIILKDPAGQTLWLHNKKLTEFADISKEFLQTGSFNQNWKSNPEPNDDLQP